MKPPRHSIRFIGHAARLAVKHGLRRGVRKAATGANPALLALEAADAVLGALGSYADLKRSEATRDGLRREATAIRQQTSALCDELDTIHDRLQAERETLKERLDQAEERADHDDEVRRAVGRVIAACQTAVAEALHAINDAYDEDLPDLDAIDSLQRELQSAQRQFRSALATRINPHVDL